MTGGARPTLLFLVIALAIALPALALAVVKPDENWFKQPGNPQLWQTMWPKLNDLEFKPQPKLNGPGTQSYSVITHNLGKSVAQYARDSGLDPNSAEAELHDLNHDGRIDQFDILELGYEVNPATRHTSTAPSKGTNQIIIMRADFADQNADYSTYNVNYWNHNFFETGATPMQSFNDYYNQVSYGALSIAGSIDTSGSGGDGWYKGQHNRNWYRDTGGGDRALIQEAVAAADPYIDFSQFDVDHDGYVDCLMMFYPNAEFSGNLWPHRSSGLNIHVDGVIIDAYFFSGTFSPDAYTEEVACHEYGHILGLPDLYDVDYSSNGIGKWSLMAYQYDGSHKVPSPDPWCKIQLGWITPTVVLHNIVGASLPDYQENPSVFKVWRNGQEGGQYFLLANYAQTLTDADRPGAGLLIEHIDDSQAGGNGDNANEYRKHDDVVSARGWLENGGTATARDHLDKKADGTAGDLGDTNDLWKSGNNATFNDSSLCDSMQNNYPSAPTPTELAVTNISAPATAMTMDITVDTANKPTCTITAPNDGDTLTGNATVNVTATPAAGRSISYVDFYCNGAYLGRDASSPYSLTFDSRPIYNGSNNRVVKAIAVDSSGDADMDSKTVSISNAATTVPFSDSFDSSISNWASYNPTGKANWQFINSSVGGRSNVAGIGSTATGYGYNEHDPLVSLRFDLTGATHPICRFKQRYRVTNGENTVKIFATTDEGQTLSLLWGGTGSALTWAPGSVDLLNYVGQKIRLVFQLDSSSLASMDGDAGWWLDDVYLKELSAPPQVLTITPGNGSTLSGVNTITVTASDDEGVAAVKFWMDGTDFLSLDNSSPYTYDWNSDWVFNGSHTFTAEALDDDGQSGSASVGWTTGNSGLSVPWAEPWSSGPGNGWRLIDTSGSGHWFWGNSLGYTGGGMKFGRNSGNYDDNENDNFISPTFDLGSLADPAISFLEKHDFETGYDFGRFYITTDLNTWTELGNWSVAGPSAWASAGWRLDSYAGQKVKLIWHADSDVGVTRQGWWVDDFNLRSAPQITSVSPSRILRGQTPLVTVTGSGFGDNGAIEASTIKLGSATLSPASWGDTQITFTLPGGAASGNLVVHRRGIDSDAYGLKVILAAPTQNDPNQL